MTTNKSSNATEQARGYNGWTNYETWVVKLWMDNEQGSYDAGREMAQQAWNDAEADRLFTREERAAHGLADQLKAEYEEFKPEVTGVWADLLTAALPEVNWHEIAGHMIDEVDKSEETEGDDDEADSDD